MMKSNTDKSHPIFRDWRNVSCIAHRLTDAEILEKFGNSTATPDTNNATWFRADYFPYHARWPSDYNPVLKQNYFTKLNGYNDGAYTLNEENKAFTTYREKRRLIEAITSNLELSQPQHRRVFSQLLSLHLGKYGIQMELVIYCVCAYAVHSDYLAGRSIRRCHPQTSTRKKDKRFVAFEQFLLARYSKITKSDIKSAYGKVQNDLCNWPRITGSRRLVPKGRPNGAREQFDKQGMDEKDRNLWDGRELSDAAGQATA